MQNIRDNIIRASNRLIVKLYITSLKLLPQTGVSYATTISNKFLPLKIFH